ncbi:MAG: hypothetical protein JWM56_499 [Candidatus Peribacteria bacterium]|nr:hypothetical protein [Candidatus Peribacteria bacterium]
MRARLLRYWQQCWQSGIFLAVCLILFVLYGYRLLAILPLYTRAAVRMNVQKQLQQFASERGVLVSSLMLRRVTDTDMTIIQREYKKGPDDEQCVRIVFASSSVTSCDASL